MFILARYSYRNLWVRRVTTALTAMGMGLVVFVFTAVLMLAVGLEQTLVNTGRADNVVFIRRSSETEVQSLVEREEAAVLESQPEIATGGEGHKQVARETVVLITLPRRSDNTAANVTVRGVNGNLSFQLRPRVQLTSGRFFQSGTAEVVIGKSIARRFAVQGLGQVLTFGGRAWAIVGIMDAGGTAFDSEIWGDVDLIMSSFRRPVYSSLIARLQDAGGFAALRDRVAKDPRLTVEAIQETEYYAAQSRLMSRFIRILGLTLTMIFGLGAIIGSMVTMYAAVANRISEIGTLRALGFRRGTILSAFLLESIFLGLIGGVLGLAGASFMDQLTISTMNWQTFSDLSFRFTLTGAIASEALTFALVMGLAGGLFPAVRAARMNIVTALRLR
jgi:putative ABC transport system permease protein